MAHYSGVSGDVTVGATAFEAVDWSADVSSAVIDVTTKADGGYQTLNGDGKKSCSVTVNGVWDDTNANHTGDPPAIKNGTSVSLDLALGGSVDSLSGTFIVETVSYSSPDGEGPITISFTANSTGTFYLPGEATS